MRWFDERTGCYYERDEDGAVWLIISTIETDTKPRPFPPRIQYRTVGPFPQD